MFTLACQSNPHPPILSPYFIHFNTILPQCTEVKSEQYLGLDKCFCSCPLYYNSVTQSIATSQAQFLLQMSH
jgi:hypothetical protein